MRKTGDLQIGKAWIGIGLACAGVAASAQPAGERQVKEAGACVGTSPLPLAANEGVASAEGQDQTPETVIKYPIEDWEDYWDVSIFDQVISRFKVGDSNDLKAVAPLKLIVAQATSEKIKGKFADFGATSMNIIGNGVIDPDDNGLFDEAPQFEENIKALFAEDYAGPACIDLEGKSIQLLACPVGSSQHTLGVEQYVKVIKAAKKVRPNAKWGFYGLPIGANEYSKQWEAKCKALKPIFDEAACLFPSAYDYYKDGQYSWHTPEMDLTIVTLNVQMALEVGGGKPVHAFAWYRYHDTNEKWGLHLIPKEEFRGQLKAIFKAEHEGDKADGIVWWGIDWPMYDLTQQELSKNDPAYAFQKKCKEILKYEMKDKGPNTYFNKLHNNRLVVLDEVLEGAGN